MTEFLVWINVLVFVIAGCIFLWRKFRTETRSVIAEGNRRDQVRRERFQRDAEARQRGENLDGSPRRETVPLTRHIFPEDRPVTSAYGGRYDTHAEKMRREHDDRIEREHHERRARREEAERRARTPDSLPDPFPSSVFVPDEPIQSGGFSGGDGGSSGGAGATGSWDSGSSSDSGGFSSGGTD